VFESKVPKKKFGQRKDEVTGGWVKLHNEELRDFYTSPSIIRINSTRMRWASHVARMRVKWTACTLLLGKPERKRPLGRPRCWWVDKIGMNLVEIE
jgi:hypothetical protein